MGTGTDTNNAPSIPCVPCVGTGYVTAYFIRDTLDHCPASLVLENTDSTEYANLSADKKAWYNLFVSAGTIDFSDGSKAWDLFLSWIFPSGISHNAIIAALAKL